MQIERKIFRELPLHNRNVFRENLIVEIERLLRGRVLIEIAAEGDEQARPSGGNGRCCIHDVELSSPWKRDRQFCREG